MCSLKAECHLAAGAYIGEISAICFLKLPHSVSQLPYLLAGTGSQLLVYDLLASKANLLWSFQIFRGIRIHGVSCVEETSIEAPNSSLPTDLRFSIAIFGEKRIKLFRLNFNFNCASCKPDRITLEHTNTFPTLNHWILDAAFLQGDNGRKLIAIGCSDNSVCVWDVAHENYVIKVQHPVKCLLYSMRIWGHNLDDLRIASGTIFNEINIWKISGNNKAVCMNNLAGHEGSVFRISWSSDGCTLISASDDRSARVWSYDDVESPVKLVLYGHSARVWDCHISDSLIVTSGEDCTCRLWDLNGKELASIKEHTGRGVWRCLYDSDASFLASAGFDSALKVHHLPSSFHWKEFQRIDDTETIISRVPNMCNNAKLMDSKSEYVRCLGLSSHHTLYVATNKGYLYCARLCGKGDVLWTQLAHVGNGPIICMDVMVDDVASRDCVAVGDGKGQVTIAHVVGLEENPKMDLTINWVAEKERQLLGIYWCKALGHRFVFTSNPAGNVKLWEISELKGTLLAEFSSELGFRVMCLNASFDEKILVCGDLRGNLILFSFSETLRDPPSAKHSASCYFKGAHGISTVSSIQITRLTVYEIEIRSTGGDGCICFLEYNESSAVLEFVGMKQIKTLSLIQAVDSHFAVGFASTEFVLWNSSSESNVARFSCGGWRRPHSFLLGDDPEANHCFAFVKDEEIVIHRNWSQSSQKNPRLRNMRVQFHGREIHTLSFMKTGKNSNESCWVSTGCEDGTVRLTRHSETEGWTGSELMGEHVGGSAVRSICSASFDDLHLLISVGAKRVVTTWLLGDHDERSVDFKWLSSDMPRKTTGHPASGGCIYEDDLRHLAVTAFIVKSKCSKFTVCFVAIASSDATLTLRALVLPPRLWFDVASLHPLSTPVLSLQHVVIPSREIELYLVISGTTDGSIAIWDVTDTVHVFVSDLSKFGDENLVSGSRRPRTGRGSQGGRLRKKTPDDDGSSDFANPTAEISPHLVLPNFHQSGVNCLHVSDHDDADPSLFCLATGGDDQGLYFFKFVASSSTVDFATCCRVRLLWYEQVRWAHNSAVKGVWTRGGRIISTGLDQRVRCWSFDENDELREDACIITSVAEPEALDVIACDCNGYRIAVAGRGLQIIDYLR